MKDSAAVSEKELVSFLLRPCSYPNRPKLVRLIQTHVSYVFVASPYVYKIKKPVNFGFLDFSTLENRRHFCECEVILNRRLCPQMYLGVIPISLTGGGLAFGPGEEVVEYAVKMRKLQSRYFMLRLLQQNKVTARDLQRIVITLKRFYETQIPAREVEAWGRIEKLKISTDENFAQTEKYIGLTISRPAFEAIRLYTDVFYSRNAELFESRINAHRIRDCHGDLHLEHIHIAPERLSIYDCIEFNDRFRYIDTANDVAFLAMDLDHHGRPDLSRQITAQMADALKDSAMLRVIDFYKCYRAYVRGKVESLHQSSAEVPEPEQIKSRMQAENYFRLALNYAVHGSEPIVLIVMGRVASGKSTLARALGCELGCEVLSSDRTRKELAGVPLYVRGGPAARSWLYSEAMTKRTYKTLLRHARSRIGQGVSVILDATFSRRHHRDELRCLLERMGATYCFIEAQAPEEIVRRRLREREVDSREVSDARLENLDMLNRSYEVPWELQSNNLVTVASNRAPEETIAETLKALACIAHKSSEICERCRLSICESVRS